MPASLQLDTLAPSGEASNWEGFASRLSFRRMLRLCRGLQVAADAEHAVVQAISESVEFVRLSLQTPQAETGKSVCANASEQEELMHLDSAAHWDVASLRGLRRSALATESRSASSCDREKNTCHGTP